MKAAAFQGVKSRFPTDVDPTRWALSFSLFDPRPKPFVADVSVNESDSLDGGERGFIAVTVLHIFIY